MKNSHTISWYLRVFPIVCLVAAFAAMPARAVEPLADGFALWGGDDDDRFVRFDLLPGNQGIELLVVGETASTVGPDLNNEVKTKLKLFVRAMNAAGTSELARFSKRIELQSKPYPDPGNALFQDFCCGGTPPPGNDPTFYNSDFGGNSVQGGTGPWSARRQISESFGGPGGFGIAENGALRSLVIGLGIDASYSNNADGWVDVSKYSFASFDADPDVNGKLQFLCQKWFPRMNGNFELESGDAGVADYLPGVVGDEIRIIDENENTGKVRYRFYDPRTCALLQSVEVTIIE